jgi:hypothetical protein
VDTYQYPGGKASAPFQIASDTAGNLYAVGKGDEDPRSYVVLHWLVRRSTDGGQTWNTVDDPFPASGTTQAKSVAVGPAGEIYVGGQASDVWTVRKSVDGGVTWNTVDSLSSGQVGNEATGLLVTPSGAVYAVGVSAKSWLVRRSLDGGATWQTVDAYTPPVVKVKGGTTGGSAQAYAAAVDGAGNVYVTGIDNSGGSARWLVRKSTNGGASFTILSGSAYRLSTYASYARAIACDALGGVYVAGYSPDAANVSHSVIRRSKDGGATWSTVDDYQYAPGKGSTVSGLIVRPGNGQVLAALSCTDSTGTNKHWVVRGSSDGGATFGNFDDYLPQGSRGNGAMGLVESAGWLYVCGAVGFPLDATTDDYYWVVRRY